MNGLLYLRLTCADSKTVIFASNATTQLGGGTRRPFADSLLIYSGSLPPSSQLNHMQLRRWVITLAGCVISGQVPRRHERRRYLPVTCGAARYLPAICNSPGPGQVSCRCQGK